MPTHQPRTLLTLPGEIREEIYRRFIITTRLPIDRLTAKRTDWYDTTPLYLCKQIKAEYSAVLERTFAKLVVEIDVSHGPAAAQTSAFFEDGKLLGLQRKPDVEIVISLQPKEVGTKKGSICQPHQGEPQEQEQEQNSGAEKDASLYFFVMTNFLHLFAELKLRHVENIKVRCIETVPPWLRIARSLLDPCWTRAEMANRINRNLAMSNQDIEAMFSNMVLVDVTTAWHWTTWIPGDQRRERLSPRPMTLAIIVLRRIECYIAIV